MHGYLNIDVECKRRIQQSSMAKLYTCIYLQDDRYSSWKSGVYSFDKINVDAWFGKVSWQMKKQRR